MMFEAVRPAQAFAPSRQKGFLLYGALFVLLTTGAVISSAGLPGTEGLRFVLLLLALLLCLSPMPSVISRLYGLWKAKYLVSRDGLLIRWGTREIYLPCDDIEWARSLEAVALEVQLPPYSWSGVIRGQVNSRELGAIEFLATSTTDMLLIATPDKVYAISPREINNFSRALQESLESGSLSPQKGYSVLPNPFLRQLLDDRIARSLATASFVLNLALLMVVSLVSPRMEWVSPGFAPAGERMAQIPAGSLRLLPLLSITLAAVDFAAGVALYRQKSTLVLSYLLWGISGLLPLLLIIAITISL